MEYNEIYNLIRPFCRKLVLECHTDKFEKETVNHMMCYIPDDIDIDRSKGDYIFLFGEYYLQYGEILEKLKKERRLEYLNPRDLKDIFWHFICEIIIDHDIYRKDLKKLDNKIGEFLASLSKPLEEYEIIVPLLNIDIKDFEFKMGNITVKKINKKFLEGLGSDMQNVIGSTGVIIIEKGNNPRSICERAIDKADFIIKILRISLHQNISIHDEDLLFRRGDVILYKKVDDLSIYGVYRGLKRGRISIPIEINQKYKDNINKFIDNISESLEMQKLSDKFKNRFIWSLTWIGRSIEQEDPDVKIIFLSTALETILTNISDDMKGENIACRMLLLNSQLNYRFVDPVKILMIYKLRSEIIHEGKIGIATMNEYITMLHVTTDILLYSLEIIRKNDLKTKDKFVKFLDSYSESNKLIDWLKNRGDKLSLEIKEQMERNLKRLSKEESRNRKTQKYIL